MMIVIPQNMLSIDDAAVLAAMHQVKDRTVVTTNGCFDLLHVGHLYLLQRAKRLGDVLIVAINSDASVKKLKGDDRPIVPQEDRAEMLNALECVDAVVLFDEATPVEFLLKVQPDIHVKGGDYVVNNLTEYDAVESYGGVCVTVGYRSGRSTTQIVQKM